MDQQNEQQNSEQKPGNLWQEIQDVKRDLAVQTATQTGAQATQAATQAGAQATQAAALSGLGMAVGAGFIAFVLGMFLGINVNRAR